MEHGKLEIANCKFNETKIDAGAGETKIISTSLNDLRLDAGVGRIEIDGEITGESKIACGIGETDIKLEQDEGEYKIIAEKGIGSLKIKGQEQGTETTYGNGKNIIKIEGGIGSIKVDF